MAPSWPWRGPLLPGLVYGLSGTTVKPLEFLLWPLGIQREPARFRPVDDVPPGLHGITEPSLALQQVGAAIDRREILGIQLMGAAPVIQCAGGVARASAHLAPALDQHSVVRG